ncbi:MAG: DNA polymerase I [Kofleriaceae bacterium]|nr:DNA polymerase I [Kofleriaceae bacterium]
MERLYILDGHGYIFRAHFGLMNSARGERREVRLSTAEGFPTGAIYVFARMLMRLHQDVHPDRIAVVFDSGRKSFRSELYPDYKAHRPDAPEDLTLQMPYFRPLVDAFRWPVLTVPGVEADDVIATLATAAHARGWEVVIYSADKDLMQLVGDGVSMVDSLRQQTYTPAEVEAKFGVPPARVADYLALVGDASDNIPGLDGVGGKTAAKLLADHGSLDALIAANPVVPRLKVKQPFSDPAQLERLAVSRQLVALRRDVPLPLSLDELHAGGFDRDALLALFRKLEFGLLVDKLEAEARAAVGTSAGAGGEAGTAQAELALPPPGTPPGPPAGGAAAEGDQAPTGPVLAAWSDVAVCVRGDELAALAQAATSAGAVGLFALGDGDRLERAHLVALALAVPRAAVSADAAPSHQVVYVPLGHRYIGAPPPPLPADLAPIVRLLADPAVRKLCHDSKRTRRLLARAGLVLAPGDGVEDAVVAAFLLDSTHDASAIDGLCGRIGAPALPRREEAMGRVKAIETIAVEATAPWLGHAAEAAALAPATLLPQLTRAGLADLYRDLELPTAEILAELESTGVRVDLPHLAALGQQVGAQLAELEQRIAGLVGEEINLGSPKQLSHILFDKLGLTSDRMKKTKTGQSVDAEVLEGLIDAHPAIRLILDHRELIKLKGTYLDALPPLVDPGTGRLHTTFNQVAAATGRISSQDPNLQNIPVRTELGRAIRRGFVAGPGQLLVAADYSQIEMRILAHLSGDPVLTRAFRDRIDVHTQTAAEVFGVPLDQVDASMRRVAKAVNYGLIYGQSDFGLARALDISRTAAHDYSTRYFVKFPTIRAFMENVVAQARAAGGARTVLGRWRPIPDLRSKSPVARRAAERVAQNTPMQGSGADIIKLAMIAAQARIRADKLPARMLLTVHDELVFEAPRAEAEAVGAALADVMQRAYPLAVPLDVDVGIADNWADC